MLSKDRDSVLQQATENLNAMDQVAGFLQSEHLPDFTNAAERVWHRLELRGFEPLRPKARVLSFERVFSAFGGSGPGIAAAAVFVVVIGATLLIMSGTSGLKEVLYTGTLVDEGETHAAASLTVDDILRILAEGREAPPVSIQIPHSGPFEMRGAPALRVGTEGFSTPTRSMEPGNNRDYN
ncbi:MAG: hypothetical protein EA428_02880 [Spirochaetaceae bacterium]|nr:MAG: hypothetical protein EA428_02880 [Spirochaetaceae bacterium]